MYILLVLLQIDRNRVWRKQCWILKTKVKNNEYGESNQYRNWKDYHNDNATDYDWNVGGGRKRNAFIQANNSIYGIDPNKHGFKTYYYGVGTLRK